MTEETRHAELPRVVLDARETRWVDELRGLQRVLLTHPVAAQAAFAALVAEGRRFARSAAGRDWARRLAGSRLLRRARLVWDATSLWMLEEEAETVMPSAYLDALFFVASSDRVELLLDELVREGMDG